MKPATNVTVGFWANVILAHTVDKGWLSAAHLVCAVILLIISIAERSANDHH